jgi:hypothetical protein
MSDVSHLLIKALSKWQFGTWMPELARKPTTLEMDLVRTMWLGGVRDAHKFDVSAVFPTFSGGLIDTAWDQNEDSELRAPFSTCLFDFDLHPTSGQRHLILVQHLPGEGFRAAPATERGVVHVRRRGFHLAGGAQERRRRV